MCHAHTQHTKLTTHAQVALWLTELRSSCSHLVCLRVPPHPGPAACESALTAAVSSARCRPLLVGGSTTLPPLHLLRGIGSETRSKRKFHSLQVRAHVVGRVWGARASLQRKHRAQRNQKYLSPWSKLPAPPLNGSLRLQGSCCRSDWTELKPAKRRSRGADCHRAPLTTPRAQLRRAQRMSKITRADQDQFIRFDRRRDSLLVL